MLHLRRSLCPRTSVTLRYLRPLCDSVCLICKSFSLSLHISDETKISSNTATCSELRIVLMC